MEFLGSLFISSHSNPNILPPGWSEWSSWGPCSSECDGGFRVRSRTCLNSDTVQCEGVDEEYEACNTFTCRNSELFVVCGGCVVEDNI